MADEKNSATWWQAIPDILKTLAAIVAGLTALVVALNQAGLFSGSDAPVPSPPQQPAGLSAAIEAPGTGVTGVCAELSNQSIFFTANNYPGILGPAGLALDQAGDGAFTFSSNMVFSDRTDLEFKSENAAIEIDDPVSGRCGGSTITFTRKLRTGSHQTYIGSIGRTPEGTITILGTFNDEEEKEFQWAGRVGDAVP